MLFADIEQGKVRLTEIGRNVSDAIQALPSHYKAVTVDCSVIMPNHIHMILWIAQGNDSSHTLGNIICGFKAEVTRGAKRKVWQRGYHEHIVRNEQDLQEIRSYIINNPIKWELDRHNPIHPRYESWKE